MRRDWCESIHRISNGLKNPARKTLAGATASVVESLERRVLFASTFGAPIISHLDSAGVDMAIGDVNSDGFPDLAISSTSVNGAARVQIFLGNANGNFTSGGEVGLETDMVDTAGIALVDLNGDHKLDIVQPGSILGSSTGAGVIDSVTGNGDGTFNTFHNLTFTGTPLSLSFADMNSDRLVDLVAVVSDSSGGVVAFRPGHGDGTFVSSFDQVTTQALLTGTLKDMNGDGTIDLATSHGVMKGNGDGTFNLPIAYPAGNGLGRLVVADFNGDGKPDVALAPGDTQTGQAAAVTVLLNNGDATFTPRTISLGSNMSDVTGLTTADLDGDGHTDLVVTLGDSSATNADHVAVLLNQGNGQFSAPTFYAAGPGAGPVLAADVNGDTRPDIIVLNTTDASVYVLPNSLQLPSTTTVTSNLNPAVAGDPVVLTAKITGPGSVAPTGTVTFMDGTTALGTGTVSANGLATLSTTGLTAGSHSIAAVYSGDGTFLTSTSAALTQTIQTPDEHNGGDVAVEIGKTTLPATIIPGDKGTMTLVIANHGNKPVAGRVAVNLYASTTGAIDSSAVQIPTPTLKNKSIKLKPGQSLRLTVRFTVPLTLPVGTYRFLANVTPVSGLAAGDVSGGFAASAPYQLVTEFGTFSGRKNVKLVQPYGDGGLVTYALKGPGAGTVTGQNGGVTLNGTSGATQLQITKKGGTKITNIGGITSNASLGKFMGNKLTLLTSLTINGSIGQLALGNLSGNVVSITGSVGKLTAGNVATSSILTTGSIGSIAVNSWTTSGTLTATSIGALTSKGEFDPLLNIKGPGMALKSANIKGAINGGAWAVGGNVGSVFIGGNVTNGGLLAGAWFGPDNARGGTDDVYAAASIGNIMINGNVTGSIYMAGLNPVDGLLLNGNDVLIPGSSIGDVTVHGTVDANSRFLAASEPTQALIGNTLVTTAKDPRFTSLTV